MNDEEWAAMNLDTEVLDHLPDAEAELATILTIYSFLEHGWIIVNPDGDLFVAMDWHKSD